MSERFLPRVGHSFTKPFVEGGRRVYQVGSDILDGGRRKRLEGAYGGPVKDSTLRDFSRATGPMALLLATIGFSVPLVIDIVQEFLAEATMAAPPGDVNWLVSLATAGGGLLIGGIANAEHSRRLGKDLRIFSEEYRDAIHLWVSRASSESNTSFLKNPQSSDDTNTS